VTGGLSPEVLPHCACHETQRRRRVGRLELVDESKWFDSLDDYEQAEHVRKLSQVDRAAAAGRRARAAA
jgi:hypothetical protein